MQGVFSFGVAERSEVATGRRAYDLVLLHHARSAWQIVSNFGNRCAGEDLNLHVLTDTRPSSVPVYQFQHPRNFARHNHYAQTLFNFQPLFVSTQQQKLPSDGSFCCWFLLFLVFCLFLGLSFFFFRVLSLFIFSCFCIF